MELYRDPGVNGFKKEPVVPSTSVPPLHLVKANQEQVQKFWPMVRLGCLIVKQKCDARAHGEVERWTPEHVRAQIELCFQGKSSCELWLMMDARGGFPYGFLVTVIANCPYTQVPFSLITWVAYTGRPIGGKNARSILKELEEYAKKLGLVNVDGYTNLPEWATYLTRYGTGYRSVLTLIRKRLWE